MPDLTGYQAASLPATHLPYGPQSPAAPGPFLLATTLTQKLMAVADR
jgi:hypothetical protein